MMKLRVFLKIIRVQYMMTVTPVWNQSEVETTVKETYTKMEHLLEKATPRNVAILLCTTLHQMNLFTIQL